MCESNITEHTANYSSIHAHATNNSASDSSDNGNGSECVEDRFSSLCAPHEATSRTHRLCGSNVNNDDQQDNDEYTTIVDYCKKKKKKTNQGRQASKQ